ncbi:glycosyltransferase family 2 protein [Tamlana sp. s12]|uniref:glycosyltransferase family 2 protein n=1 Tax=Tamlana sp. s12 TaxID=1630406 RepID=UPI000AA6287A|nr:glycosyltransferase family 2 protein [Tamlana sp. s12]QQY83774.1 glycosyltransferase family 2 protein [Tamlana sp. s12]
MVNTPPYFSVIIPLYNKETELKKTLNSVLNQTFSDFEIIIINDGSTDNSLSVAQSFNSKKIKIHNQPNKGLSFSRNKGILLASGKFVALLDADDLWENNYLQVIYNMTIKHPNESIFATGYKEKRNKKILPYSKKKNTKPVILKDFFQVNFNAFILDQSSLVFKRSFLRNRNYNSNITYNEDVDFYLNHLYNRSIVFAFQGLMIKNYDSGSQLSGAPISKHIIPDLDYYQVKHKELPSAIKFIDIQRYKYAIKYTYEGNYSLKEDIVKKINKRNLSYKQRIMLCLPKNILIQLRACKFFILNHFKIRLTSY